MTMMTKQCYKLVVRVTIEAKTPLCIGSGEKSILTDSMVIRDVNGLPYIPGTTLAGVLRKELPQKEAERYFGTQRKGEEHGSEIVLSEARMIGKDGKVVDGLQQIDWGDEFYAHYKMLPIRQHVRISHRGVGDKAGKFDEEVVMKGTRFVFEIERTSSDEDISLVKNLLECMASKEFRIGGGSNKGFGCIKMINCSYRRYCLNDSQGLESYLLHSSDLSETLEGGEQFTFSADKLGNDMSVYELILVADDFFLFGAGMGNADADNIPVTESIVIWDRLGMPQIKEGQTLIPASSLKGALLHRTLYHYNRNKGIFADNKLESDIKALSDDSVVRNELFGNALNTTNDAYQKGKAIFNDIILERVEEKVFNHVKIDRITGGTVDGALFTESVSHGAGHPIKTEIIVTQSADKDVIEAFEQAMQDLCGGMLPLGGATNRGYGVFKGTLKRNGKIIYPTK